MHILAKGGTEKPMDLYVRFRGRELAHTDRGEMVLNRVRELLGDDFTIEKRPHMEGRFMSMFLSPKSKK